MKPETLNAILNIEDSLEKLLVAKAIVLNTLPHAVTEDEILGVFTLCAEFLVDATDECCEDCCCGRLECSCNPFEDGCRCGDECCANSPDCQEECECNCPGKDECDLADKFDDCQCWKNETCSKDCECPCHVCHGPHDIGQGLTTHRVVEPEFNPVIRSSSDGDVMVHRVIEPD